MELTAGCENDGYTSIISKPETSSASSKCIYFIGLWWYRLISFAFRIPFCPHLFVSLASASGVANGADDPGPSQWVVGQQPWPVGQVMAVGVGAWVRVGHGGDDCGLHHPLQVLAGCDCIDCGDEGTVGARHVNPVLLKKEGSRTLEERECMMEENVPEKWGSWCVAKGCNLIP